jgi:predicted PhzF superfamily epimerase YddE/YHI9
VARLHVLRVFTGPEGSEGNHLGVFLAGTEIPAARRQDIARDLGFSETVFVDEAASVRIYTPATELPFAGHPLVGTGWLLVSEGLGVGVLRPPAGDVPTWSDGERQWIRGRAEWAPQMTIREYADPAAVDALHGPPAGEGFLDAWAWEDRSAGAVRVRVFAPRVGVPEDEATGAAAIRLTERLGVALRIRQGRGSEILTRVDPEGTVEVGGRVVLEAVRTYEL